MLTLGYWANSVELPRVGAKGIAPAPPPCKHKDRRAGRGTLTAEYSRMALGGGTTEEVQTAEKERGEGVRTEGKRLEE